MPVIASFLTFLKRINVFLSKGYSWLKVQFEEPKTGTIKEVTNSNISQITGSNGEQTNNVNQTNINIKKVIININESDPNFDPEKAKKIAESLGEGVEKHEGYGISLDDGVSVLRSIGLTDIQKDSLKTFKKVGWPNQILAPLSIAYKIIDLEDKGDYKNAQTLMNEAFGGRSGPYVRKLYNLARAGYIEGFVLDAIMSPISYGGIWISKTLEYFPEAIFVDENSTPSNIVDELLKREAIKIQKVTLFSRGNKIETLNQGYSYYIDKRFKTADLPESTPFFVYIICEEENYSIAWSKAKRMVVKLEAVRNVSLESLRKHLSQKKDE